MIYIVGAGPGDLGLLTLRGYEVLKRADIVIYDNLVGEGILSIIPEAAEKLDAGKSAGNHKMKQSEIEAAMIKLSSSGKNIVRLKGGDPFLFGRGGEEAEALIRAGINFEIVSGVSSALSVPAYAGIPATHRDYSSGVKIFTAHDKNNLIPNSDSSTSIFLMGVANSEALQNELLKTMEPLTPCSIIENGTKSSQRVIRTTLAELHASIVRENIVPPAVIVAGGTAELNLDWRSNLPLNGKKIIVTRPENRAGNLSLMLRDLGAEVVLLPTIKTRTLHGAIDGVNLTGYDWIGFTSVTGVEALMELLSETGRDVRELGSAKIAAIGQATKDALNSHGLKVDYVPEVFDGVHLAEGLAKSGGKILMLRAQNGTPEIQNTFINYGIIAEQICIYRTDYVKLSHVPKFADIIIFTSSSTVRGFAENSNLLRDSFAVCIGKQTANEAMRAGFNNIRIAEQATISDIVNACVSINS